MNTKKGYCEWADSKSELTLCLVRIQGHESQKKKHELGVLLFAHILEIQEQYPNKEEADKVGKVFSK